MNIFERVEKKYLLPPKKQDAFMDEFVKHMAMDSYGLSTICNVYYDNENHDLIVRSLDKPAYKEKFRIRSYGVPKMGQSVFLEIKKKVKGVVYKRRVEMRYEEAMTFLINGERPLELTYEEEQILNEIEYMFRLYNLSPALYLAYDRTAWYNLDGDDLRVTFDEHIRSRTEDMDLTMGDYGEELLPPGYRLMEVKTASALPLWFVRLLNDMEIYPVSFSKFGNIYTVQQGGSLSCLAAL